MASRQFEHLQEQSLARLRALVPAGCPLRVLREPRGGFRVATTDRHAGTHGRFQIVATWIDGYVAAWKCSLWNANAAYGALITARVRPPDRAAIRSIQAFIAAAAACTCRTASCGHRADEHGPNGVCVICGKACWS